MQITLTIEHNEPADFVAQLKAHPRQVTICWVRDKLSSVTMLTAEPVDDRFVELTFELDDTHPAGDPLDPGDLVFAPPIGCGDFDYLNPPSPRGRPNRLKPHIRVTRIEQRPFTEKRVSLTRVLAVDAYNDVLMRDAAAHGWLRELNRDLHTAGVIALADVTTTWHQVDDETSTWEEIPTDAVVVDVDRVWCVLTTVGMEPCESLVVTYDGHASAPTCQDIRPSSRTEPLGG